MGRPEPCVLFSQTFAHPQLDEYVDEVLFNESIVITACEFIEQNASSASSVVTLVGATSPPSFALEVFVQCEGEPRFRRLCQPFLYSHSSSNMLEVEAVVTNHLVVRGSYRSLTLVVYGNTAEDLGQFNIEFDLDSSLANLVCSPSEGKLEDLPPALHSTKLMLEEAIFSPKLLSLLTAEPNVSSEVEQFLELIIRIFGASVNGDTLHKVLSTVISTVSSYVSSDLGSTAITWNPCKRAGLIPCKKELKSIFIEAKNELEELHKLLKHEASSSPVDPMGEGDAIESEAEVVTSPAELLPDLFSWYYLFVRNCPRKARSLSQNKSMVVGLSIVLLLCSGRETCFHFVNGGGMEQLVRAFDHKTQKSTSVRLMLLGVIERATRFATGCEGFLGWWPREDEIVPVGSSEGYSQILKLLLQKQRHDVASLASYLLHRLRFYEVASRYESAVLSLLAGLSDVGKVTNVSLIMLDTAKLQLKQLLRLLNSCGPIEDPSPVANASRTLILGQSDGILSYRATINLIVGSSDCCFSKFDIDPHLLPLLKERGFLPLSAALLSSSVLRSEKGHTLDLFLDITSLVEAILLSLLLCRSGLVFLLLQPEIAAALVYSLKGVEEMNNEECVPLRYASVLINKGFFCRPQDVGTITELHLRVVNAIDRLLESTPQSEDLLWVLWELCGLSRSDSGRQALLALRHFPEAISVLMEALRSAKNPDGSSPLHLAIFHSAAEIFEVIVTDSTASSLGSWIEHSVELHNVLHDPSPGSNRKDAPARLLEWVDAGVVYQRNGAIGLLRYAAVLASNGDASSILASDSMDIENAVGDSGSGSDVQVTENLLGKLVLDKGFDGTDLRDSSIAQLTTTFRILSSVSENLSVAGALYEEGAVTLVYIVLLNCKFMLEGSPRAYAHLVDEGGEGNSMSDLLAERGREQSLVDLMIPCLLLLNTLLHKLQEAKEQHRNTKLLNALLRLHREVSPKLAACAADLSCPYPSSALGLGAICHLIVSALACWPVFGWTPDLFHCLLESVQATSSLALGPKEACSLLCLLGDLFPEEGVWLWKQGMPSLSALKALAIATLLGPPKEKLVFWYLEPEHVAMLLSRLTPLLDKIAEIILHFAFTALVVIQDMLRVLIIRVACQNFDSAAILLRPIITWIHDHVSDAYSLSDTESFKVFRLLEFLASLLEHPSAKTLLLKEGVASILIKALDKCYSSLGPEVKMTTESRTRHFGFSLLNWCIPVFKSVILICESETLQLSGIYDDKMKLTVQDCFLILHHLLRFCQVLPVGKELLASLFAFKELSCCSEGKSAFVSFSTHFQSSGLDELELERGREQDGNDGVIDNSDWRRCPPLLYCWRNLFRSISGRDWISTCAIEAVGAMSLGVLYLCFEGKSLNLERIAVLKCLFGLPFDCGDTEQYPEESLKDFSEMISLLDSRIVDAKQFTTSDVRSTLSQVKEMAKLLLVLFRKPTGSIKVDDIIPNGDFSFLSSDILDHFAFSSKSMMSPICEDAGSSSLRVRKSDDKFGKADDLFSLNGLSEKFLWDCPDAPRDGSSISSHPAKRKMASTELPNRRARVDSSGAESTGLNAFPRGLGPPTASSVPTRRDTFRQRKPNTSRPPSMHVDDYVARERNIDGGSSGSNVVSSVHRGITGGRPPSIHVDEFMARQRERQASVPMAGGEGVAQTSNVPPENNVDPDKVDRSRQLKVDLDDDLQEINIVFDDEESESDDRLPFPQPDDNLQPAPVVVEGNSPRSIVEETGSDTIGTNVSNLGTPSASNVDENTQSEFSSRRSVSRSEKPLSREESISSERKFIGGSTDKPMPREKSDVSKHSLPVMASKGHDSATTNFSGFPPPFYKGSASSGQLLGDARGTSSNFYQRDSPQHAATVQMVSPSQGLYNQKLVPNQPPLPPMPPPPNVSRVPSHNAEHVQSHSAAYGHNARDKQPPLPPGFPSQAFEASGSVAAHNYAAASNPSPSSSAFVDSLSDSSALQLHTDYLSTFNTNSATLFGAPHTMFDSKYSWASVSSASRLHDEINPATSGLAWPPPLPPTPPPFSSSSMIQSSVKSSASQSPGYNQTNAGTIQLPMNSNSPSNDARLGSFSAAGGNLTSYSPPQLVPPLLNSRPASIPVSLFSSPTIHQGQNLPSLAHSVSTPQPSILSMQPRPQLQPLQPPQPSHPHPQHLRPPTQVSQQQSELSLLQGPIQVQSHPFQIHQQPHIAPIHVYYPTQQHESLANAQQQQQNDLSQPQPLQQLGDSASQQQQDSEMSLQQYFASPEAIQSLISDREKLCQLLEHHPKLMQMLQERLGQ